MMLMDDANYRYFAHSHINGNITIRCWVTSLPIGLVTLSTGSAPKTIYFMEVLPIARTVRYSQTQISTSCDFKEVSLFENQLFSI